MAKILLSGFLLMLTATASFAQDYGIAYTSTVLDWDEGANILEASCSVDLDYVAQAYYESATNCYIYHDSNIPAHILANNWGYGSNHAEVDLEYDYPTSNTSYSTQGTFFVTMPYYYQAGPDYYYYDPYDYLYYDGVGVYEPFSYEFPGFNDSEYVEYDDTLFLGYVYDSLTTTPGPPDHVRVITDIVQFPPACPSTGIAVRQMQMQVVDSGEAAIGNNASIVEAYDQRPTNTCTGQQIPAASGCAATGDGGTGQFIDTMVVSLDLCNSGISHTSSCGFTLTSTWSACSGGHSNQLWQSSRVTHANGVSVEGNTTGYGTGTTFH
jgi:hypothetical protein